REEDEFRRADQEYREQERAWRRLDDKRRRVQEITSQIALLARLSALMGGFQVAMYINQGVPPSSERWPNATAAESIPGKPGESVWEGNHQLNDGLVTLWAFCCVSVIVLNFSIMVVASLIQLAVVHATYREGFGEAVISEDQYHLRDCTDGIIVNEEQFMDFWRFSYQERFQTLMKLFSYGVPVVVPFICVWAKYHSQLVVYITHNPEDPEGHAHES
ncbi:hypothetical protein T484DRAFT_1924949, partial [Baffinella frigidus]